LYCVPSLSEAIDKRVPVKDIEDFSIFYTSISRTKYPSVLCALVANKILNTVDMIDSNFLNNIICYFFIWKKIRVADFLSSDYAVCHSELLDFWTFSIAWYSKNLNTQLDGN
jgi:hypothetical protein